MLHGRIDELEELKPDAVARGQERDLDFVERGRVDLEEDVVGRLGAVGHADALA